MPRLPVLLLAPAVLAAACLPDARAATAAMGAAGPAAPLDRQAEVQMQAGLALPLGELGAGFAHTRRGLGAAAGYDLGLRVRFYPGGGLVLAPGFGYVDFGDHEGRAADGDVFRIGASILRYGLDLYHIAPGDGRRIRPFLGAGVAVVRHKYRERFVEAATEYKAAVNGLALSLVCGVRRGDWDLVLRYETDRFATSLFAFDGVAQDHRWNYLLLSAGFTLPRI